MICNNYIYAALSCLICLYGCADDTGPFVDIPADDPYCLEIEDWEKETQITIQYEDDLSDRAFSVAFESERDS